MVPDALLVEYAVASRVTKRVAVGLGDRAVALWDSLGLVVRADGAGMIPRPCHTRTDPSV